MEKEEIKEELKEEVKTPVELEKGVKWREILILTNGDSIKIERADVAGKIELVGILQNLIAFLSKQNK